MSITVTPTRSDFTADISGIDLAQPLKAADRDAIEDAINRYAVVVFHDQKLSDDQQIDFAIGIHVDGGHAFGIAKCAFAGCATLTGKDFFQFP